MTWPWISKIASSLIFVFLLPYPNDFYLPQADFQMSCFEENKLEYLTKFTFLTLHPQKWILARRKDLLGLSVLPAVGWLGGLALFVKVMGPRWVSSQATWCTLRHLRRKGELTAGAETWGGMRIWGVDQLSPKPPQLCPASFSSTWKWLPGQPWANKAHMDGL